MCGSCRQELKRCPTLRPCAVLAGGLVRRPPSFPPAGPTCPTCDAWRCHPGWQLATLLRREPCHGWRLWPSWAPASTSLMATLLRTRPVWLSGRLSSGLRACGGWPFLFLRTSTGVVRAAGVAEVRAAATGTCGAVAPASLALLRDQQRAAARAAHVLKLTELYRPDILLELPCCTVYTLSSSAGMTAPPLPPSSGRFIWSLLLLLCILLHTLLPLYSLCGIERCHVLGHPFGIFDPASRDANMPLRQVTDFAGAPQGMQARAAPACSCWHPSARTHPGPWRGCCCPLVRNCPVEEWVGGRVGAGAS